MADIENVKAGDVISFRLKTNIISDIYTQVKVVAVAGYELAKLYEDVDAIHASIIGSLPQDTPNSPQDYNYVIVDLIDGKRKVIGFPWIEDNIEFVNSAEIVITIPNASISMVDTVVNALNAYGISDFNTKVNTTS